MTEDLLKALLLKRPGQGEAPQLYWDANGDCYRLWQLRTEIEPKYGSIMIEPAEGHPMMNPAWQRVALSMPFWIAYHLTYFTTDVQVTIGRKVPFVDEDLKRPAKRSKTEKGGGSRKKAKKTELLMTSSNGLVGGPDNESGIFSMGVDPDFADTIDSLMPQDLGTGSENTLMSNNPETTAMAQDKADLRMEAAWNLAVGPRGLSPNAFKRFDIRVSQLIYDTVAVQEDVEMKTITGANAFLSYLSLRRWLQPDQITALKMNFMLENQINLDGIISLVFDDFLKTSFFSLLPIKLDKKALDHASGFSDVKSLNFSVKPPAAHQKWDIQYEVAGNQTATWQVKVLSELRFFIYRPFERDFRYVYGSFLGKLSNGQGSNVIIDFLWFPDKDSGLDYHLRFADDDFVSEGYVMKVGDLWSAIPPSFSTINTLAAAILLPGKDTALEFGDFMRIQDCGFVVHKNSPVVADVTLRRVFGTKKFDPKQQFKPFGDMITIRLPTIGLQVENLFSTVPLKLFVRIEERLDIKGSTVPIVFETRRPRGGDKTIYQLSYIASSSKQDLTPARLLNWLGISNTNLSDIPGLEKLLGSLHVLSFGLGWLEGTPEKSRTKPFSAKLDFMELAIRLDRLDLVPDYLAVENAFLELRLDQQGSGFNTSLTSYARLTIGNCDVQFLISYGERPEWESVYAYNAIPGHFRLALSTGDTGVLSLSNILGHFVPNVQCLPPALQKVLLRTGISKFRLGIGKDEAGKNVIAMIHLEVMLEEDDMEIFEGLSISSPKLTLRIDYPNDEDARTISASISVLTDIRDEEFNATIWLDAKEDTIIGMSIVPVSESIALGEIIAFFSQTMSESFKLDLPSDFSFMQGIDSGPTYVSFRKTAAAGYKLDSVFVHVEANRDFEVWDSPRVVLSDVNFLMNYIRGSGVHVGFGVSLAVGNYEFSGALFYDRASTDVGLVDDTPKDEKPKNEKGVPPTDGGAVALGKDKSTSYTVQLEFEGEVGLHDILSTLTGTNFADMLQRTGLEAFSKYTDIKIHTIALALAKAPSSWTFSVVANLDWLAFTNVNLTASHEASWAFNLQLQCKDGPLKILTDSWAASVARFVELGDTSIYLFYGPISNTLRGQQLTLSNKSRRLLGDKGGVAISTNLNLGSDLKILREWLKLEGLQVFGAAGAGFFVLGVKVGMLTLVDDAFKLSGGFLLSYIDNELWIGVEGDFAFNIPAITKSTITGTIAAGVNLSTGGLGLKANTNEALKDVGGIKGFDLDAVAFEIELAPEAELMPTTLGVEGGVRVQGLDNVSGRLAVKFVAKSPMNCYVEGKIENLNLTGLLAKFAAAIDLPPERQNFLQKNGVNLRFLAIQLIPKDMVGMTNQQLKRRIYFEGALSIVINDKPIWAGFVLLDIKDSGFVAIALMEPVQAIDPSVFSIQRSSKGVSAASYNLQLPQVKPEYLTPRMLNEGPVLKIASEGPDPVFVSAHLRFLGTQHDLYAVVNGDSFVAEFHSKASVGSLDFSVNCHFNSAVAIAAEASLDLGEHTLMLITTLSALDGALDRKVFERPSDKITSVGFSGGLKVSVAWTSGRDPLSINLSGKAQAFGKKWDIGEIGIKITESDLRSLEAFASQLWEYIKDSFAKLVMTWIRDIQTEVTAAIKFLEENWKVASQELVRLVSDIKNIPITDIIVPVLKELDIIYKEALNLLDDLGIGKFLGVKLLSPLYGKDPPPDRRPGWEPDVPDDVLKLPKKPKRNEPILSPDDILDGFPGTEKHDKKPDSSPKIKPVDPKPVDPFEIPDDIGFGAFSARPKPAFISVSYTEAEHEAATSSKAFSKTAEDVVVARLPAWYAKEIERYVSSPISPVSSDSAGETLAQISSFDYEEVLAIAKVLRTAGLSAKEVQQVYKDDIGQNMPSKLAEQI
ncbi:ankyrin repeat and socs box protein 6 [Fusarium sporotrichioides]|uniref:Ankyrin repeat and socs box protein 6 n=1 Tax=Fusarium sporotrichioides TaxID=5514 RepID=A0A395REV3_FUSSP|nr:ankyrin repeat and socs box protein 6 [Fusarium sporotrichioides]